MRLRKIPGRSESGNNFLKYKTDLFRVTPTINWRYVYLSSYFWCRWKISIFNL